ncbi:M24 family metallopeptidase [soil metagenome]
MTRACLPAPILLLVLGLTAAASSAGCAAGTAEEPPPASIVVPARPAEADWARIRTRRIQTFLLPAMQKTGIDMWLVMARGDNNDPLAKFVGGEHAIGDAVYIFSVDGTTLRRTAIVPLGDSTPVRESGEFDEVLTFVGGGLAEHLAATVKRIDPSRIGINMSGKAVLDGISATQKAMLERVLGAPYASRLEPAEPVVVEYLNRKLPEEVKILREAARLTDLIEREAYATVEPGRTTDLELAERVRARVRELGLGFSWDEGQNPNVTSGLDRGHSPAANRVIQPGDIIMMDFGIRLWDHWVTDVQRFAYVLKPGEQAAPADAQHQWEAARDANRAALAAMRPGTRGVDVDRAQMAVGKARGCLDPIWSTGHPVGYWAHDVGPTLGGSRAAMPPEAARRPLEPWMTFSFDGFCCVEREDAGVTGMKCISVEEMAVVTDRGAEYLVAPQEELILIRSGTR